MSGPWQTAALVVVGLWLGLGGPVRGQPSLPAAEKKTPLREDFFRHYTFQVPRPQGGKQTLMDFPGLMKLKDGQWLTIYIEELQHGTPPIAAMPSSGKLWTARSADGGKNWTPPRIWLDTPLDDRHAYTLQLQNGKLLAFFWVQTVAFGMDSLFNYVAFSDDGGLTWEDPLRFGVDKPAWPAPPRPGVRGSMSLTNPPIELPDGTLAMAIDAISTPPSEAGILRSRDGGRSWGDYTPVAVDRQARINFNEPCMVRLASGKWLLVMRTTIPLKAGTTAPYTNGPTMICFSTDEGRTWSKPERLPLPFTWTGSTAPFIIQTRTGVVVFAVNTGIAFSYDDGRTWEAQNLVPGYYPNLLEIAPGTVATIACELGGHVFSLRKPRPAVAPAGKPHPLPIEPRPAAAKKPPGTLLKLSEIRGLPRAIRVRGPRAPKLSPLLGQPDYPLLAAARATAQAEEVITALLTYPDRPETWPLLIARAANVLGDPLLSQSRAGELHCFFAVKTAKGPNTMLASSSDGGLTWTKPRPLAGENPDTALVLTAPPIQTGDGSWLAAATLVGPDPGSWVVVQFNGGFTTWRVVAKGPGAVALTEPALAVARDGRWIVAGRQGQFGAIVAVVSKDRGQTWSPPKPLELIGARPELVELLEGLFLVSAEGPAGELRAAFTWDNLDFAIARPLACGYSLQVDGRKTLARGSGVDMAGRINHLAQVPLPPEENAAALKRLNTTLPLKSGSYTVKGQWQISPGPAGAETLESADSQGAIDIPFEGHTVALVYDVMPAGRLLGVRIDGREYPPVDMSGPARVEVVTCLAANLPPGRHQLSLWPLLPWKTGKAKLYRLKTGS